MKEKLIVSFSSGESSAFMAQWCKNNLSDKYEIKFVMCNTSEENEKSLEFADKVDKYFGLNLTWIECVTNSQHGEGVGAKVVSYKTACRNGDVFEAVIAKQGIPNTHAPICTREMKNYTVRAYCREIGWNEYAIAVGFRIDESGRILESHLGNKIKFIYPLISLVPMTKPAINRYWRDMPFRVELKGYEDNCKVCFKKSLRKLLTIAKHHPERFDNFLKWEKKYENYIPESRILTQKARPPIRFYRGKLSVMDILEMSKMPFEEAPNERERYVEYKQLAMEFDGEDYILDNGQGRCSSEACDAFS